MRAQLSMVHRKFVTPQGVRRDDQHLHLIEARTRSNRFSDDLCADAILVWRVVMTDCGSTS